MKGMLELLRSYPSRVYGFLFALIILSALLAFFLAQSGSSLGLGLILAILITANLLVILI
jgi:ABC-type phosphate transport system permease subunit